MDFRGNPASAIVTGRRRCLMGGRMMKALSWYDNEWGYACRLADLCALLGRSWTLTFPHLRMVSGVVGRPGYQ